MLRMYQNEVNDNFETFYKAKEKYRQERQKPCQGGEINEITVLL